jgi:hypothetical protein
METNLRRWIRLVEGENTRNPNLNDAFRKWFGILMVPS